MEQNTSSAAKPSFFRRHGSTFSFLAVIAVILALYFGSGLRLCAVVSGSMEPNLPVWSLCVVSTRTDFDDLDVGDIIVYIRDSDGKRIIHRVIDFEDGELIMKGAP